jgi:hypothetical protein
MKAYYEKKTNEQGQEQLAKERKETQAYYHLSYVC